jgi:rhodanese-related sulfurtransferase
MAKTSHDLVVEAKQRIKEVTPVQARELLQAGAVVLDVREPMEFAAGHLPDAINIPRGLLEFRLAATPELTQTEKPIVVYCKTSGRAALATVVMQTMGVDNAVSVEGGYDAWVEAGFPVDTPPVVDFG